jgi:DNA-directed RNA polymerase specialized sigma24 family protein
MITKKLTEYIRLLNAKYLNESWGYSIDDCTQDCLLALWQHKSGIFIDYLNSNTIPESNDLSLLKSIVHNQKLVYLKREDKACPRNARKWLFNRQEESNNE